MFKPLAPPPPNLQQNKEEDTWEEVKVSAGRSPARRYGHSAVLYGYGMIVFGGYDCDSFTCADLWSFSFGTYCCRVGFHVVSLSAGRQEGVDKN